MFYIYILDIYIVSAWPRLSDRVRVLLAAGACLKKS